MSERAQTKMWGEAYFVILPLADIIVILNTWAWLGVHAGAVAGGLLVLVELYMRSLLDAIRKR